MALSKLTMALLVLMVLTTTWARSISQHLREINSEEAAEHGDGSMERYWNKENDNGEISLSNEMLIRKYGRPEDSKFSMKGIRTGGKKRRSLHGNEAKAEQSFSPRRLEKMLEKAILQIITGDLSTSDMLLLKSLNYSLEEVLAIRERELGMKNYIPKSSNVGKKIIHQQKINNQLIDGEEPLTENPRANQVKNYDGKTSKKKKKNRTKSVPTSSSHSSNEKKSVEEDLDFEAYNRQAIYDYENEASRMSQPTDLDPVTTSIDYENHSNDNIEAAEVVDDLPEEFNRPEEPHVVFKIRYDDSEFDSSSNERFDKLSKERISRLIPKSYLRNSYSDRKSKNTTIATFPSTNESFSAASLSSATNATPANNGIKTFLASTVDVNHSVNVAHRLDNFVGPHDGLTGGKSSEHTKSKDTETVIEINGNFSLKPIETSTIVQTSDSSDTNIKSLENNNVYPNKSMDNETNNEWRRNSMYEGLEWVEDDVYRVIPEAFDSLNYYDASINEMANDSIEDSGINETHIFEMERKNENEDNGNDTTGYQNENPDVEEGTQTEDGFSTNRNSPNLSLSTYQQLALAHRREGNITSPSDSQGQKAIEDIKLKVLAMTGRFNLSSNGNQVQRERLTMFSPICQIPRNTDSETWFDPFLMNMNFQLNLTSEDHVVAAKVRIYVLPQHNVTATPDAATEAEDEEEKKIRISIYFYTKSLKKHRSKKRLIDSVVASLTTQGSHWALDVRPALRFWRQNVRNSHSINNNHGLVIQVEDQDGRSLEPSQYIQQDSCHTSELNNDEKAYQRVPALFLQACSRYIRVVNGEPVTYVNCSKSSLKGRH